MKFTVNGHSIECTAPSTSKALFVLRNELGCHDVRIGCGEGHCGACTVLVDGRPTTTCDLAIWAVEDKHVTTARGLGSEQSPHPLQSALLKEQAGQCGYCLSGIMMTAASLLARPSRPTEMEVREALDRHLCRCGTHHRILQAIMHVASRCDFPPQVTPPALAL